MRLPEFVLFMLALRILTVVSSLLDATLYIIFSVAVWIIVEKWGPK